MISIIAINVFVKSNIINKNGTPILFYWNGQNDVQSEIRNNSQFIEWLAKNDITTNIDNYLNSSLSYLFFSDTDATINGNESYGEYQISMQNFIKINELPNDDIYKIGLNYIYKASFGNDYEFSYIEKDTRDIYNMIVDKYGDKVSKDTVINAIRGHYQSEYKNLSVENLNIIIKNIESFISYGVC